MRDISGYTAVAVLALAGVALAAARFETVRSSATMVPVSDSERKVEQCMSSGGVEETCILDEMKRTMLANQS
jgi:hypothetical protein